MQMDIVLTRSIFVTMPVFHSCMPSELLLMVQSLKPLLALPGEKILEEGVDGIGLFFITRGAVEVSKGGEFVSMMYEGFFGEESTLTSQKISATVRAVKYSDFLVLPKAVFEGVMEGNATMRKLVQEYVNLRNANRIDRRTDDGGDKRASIFTRQDSQGTERISAASFRAAVRRVAAASKASSPLRKSSVSFADDADADETVRRQRSQGAASFRAARSEARAHGFTLDSRAPSGRFNLNNVYGSGALAAEPPPVDVSRGPSAATLRLKGSSPLNLKGVAVGSPPRIGPNKSAAPP